ncbi:MAG: putative effector of murein hydrolase [Porticoccaceae bacterium]|jgi:putative effector of murein hydrolase|nr:LrgB family protein [SAR92 clade bacterium]MDB9977347.1 LrgB family protein [Porticoccaceae bacterium]|tara:strand:+ start:5080 stop:5799 length:720 start_codon:yes stop_codon:yes gene_type:complete
MTDLLAMQWQQITASSWIMLLSVTGFWLGMSIYRRSSGKPLLHPLIIGTPFIAILLVLMSVDFDQYYKANGLLSWLLGPATVALAVPLSKYLKQMSKVIPILTIAVLFGGFFAAVSALSLALWLTSEPIMMLSIAAKSVTTPIAMVITQQLGGLVTLITPIVLFTGIVGILVAPQVFQVFGLQDERWQGLILGVTAHAIGTLKAFEKSPRCGAFSTIGMGLNGIWTSLFLVPMVQIFMA